MAFGLLSAAAAVGFIIMGLPADLFGRVPRLSGHVEAGAAEVAVVDGQTLRVAGTVLRLDGVDAPVRGGLCGTDGAAHDCGAAASAALAALVAGRGVLCNLHGRDRQGMPLADCTAGDVALNRAMARQPWLK